MITINQDLMNFHYLQYKLGKIQLPAMRNKKTISKKNGNIEDYLAISAALLLAITEQEMGK